MKLSKSKDCGGPLNQINSLALNMTDWYCAGWSSKCKMLPTGDS